MQCLFRTRTVVKHRPVCFCQANESILGVGDWGRRKKLQTAKSEEGYGHMVIALK